MCLRGVRCLVAGISACKERKSRRLQIFPLQGSLHQFSYLMRIVELLSVAGVAWRGKGFSERASLC